MSFCQNKKGVVRHGVHIDACGFCLVFCRPIRGKRKKNRRQMVRRRYIQPNNPRRPVWLASLFH